MDSSCAFFVGFFRYQLSFPLTSGYYIELEAATKMYYYALKHFGKVIQNSQPLGQTMKPKETFDERLCQRQRCRQSQKWNYSR